MVKPTISVIIPCFNSETTIKAAICSALASKDVDIEVIVVDDGSTDGSLDVLRSFGNAINLLCQERGGPYRARNLAANHAKGQWLAFLDADDDWLPEKLSLQLQRTGQDVGLVYTDRLNFGDIENVADRQSDCVTLHEGDIFEDLLVDNFITLSSVLLEKKWFDRLGGFSTTQQGVQDWDMWLRFTAAGGQVALVKQVLTRYRMHDGQMSKDSSRRAADRQAVLDRALASDRGRSVASSRKRKGHAALNNLAATDASADGRRTKAFGYLLRSMAMWPFDIDVHKQIIKCVIGRN